MFIFRKVGKGNEKNGNQGKLKKIGEKIPKNLGQKMKKNQKLKLFPKKQKIKNEE